MTALGNIPLTTEVPTADEAVLDTLYDANTILKADSDNTPAALTMGASTILARLAAGSIVAATPAELRTLLDVPTNAEAILDALVDAKGDLIAATAADTVARLAVGANDTVLTADSAQATGMKWAYPKSRRDVLSAAFGLKGESYPMAVNNTTNALTSQRVQAQAIGLFEGDVVTNVHVCVTTVASGVTTIKGGLYSNAYASLGLSANLTTIFANTEVVTFPLSSPYTVLATGLYFVAVLSHATTAGNLLGMSSQNPKGQAVLGSAIPQWTQTGQTDLPSTATPTGANPSIWVAWS